MNCNIFRENDIRGLVDEDLTPQSVEVLALAVGTFFRRRNVKCVALGRDARHSSQLFRDIFVRGLNQTGLNVLDIGAIPTPVLYFALFTEKASAGVMITGSHNPKEYNGFKLCLGSSAIFGAGIQEIRRIVASSDFARGQGTLLKKDILPDYINFISQNIKLGKKKLKAVIDGGNGIAGIAGTSVYRKLDCETVGLFVEPDGNFPNHHPDPTQPENLQTAIKILRETGADLAIAFDGDGDRIGVVDENGNIIPADKLLIIYARSILEKRPQAAFVADVKCSQNLFDEIRQMGGQAIMWKTGHALIKAKMKETGALLAGEMSGHIYFADRFFGFDDAIYAGARLLEILSNTEQSLSELLNDLPPIFNTPEIRVACPDENKFEIVRLLTDEFKKSNKVVDIDGARILFENGWGLVRASNTQPVLTMRFEAADKTSLEQIQEAVEMRLHGLIVQMPEKSGKPTSVFGNSKSSGKVSLYHR